MPLARLIGAYTQEACVHCTSGIRLAKDIRLRNANATSCAALCAARQDANEKKRMAAEQGDSTNGKHQFISPMSRAGARRSTRAHCLALALDQAARETAAAWAPEAQKEALKLTRALKCTALPEGPREKRARDKRQRTSEQESRFGRSWYSSTTRWCCCCTTTAVPGFAIVRTEAPAFCAFESRLR
jgi:hypothetical protein